MRSYWNENEVQMMKKRTPKLYEYIKSRGLVKDVTTKENNQSKKGKPSGYKHSGDRTNYTDQQMSCKSD